MENLEENLGLKASDETMDQLFLFPSHFGCLKPYGNNNDWDINPEGSPESGDEFGTLFRAVYI